MIKYFLTKKIPSRIHDGHNWIFKHEIAIKEALAKAGTLIAVHASNGSFVGKGFCSDEDNQVAVRIITREEETTIDASFFERKIKVAQERRRLLNLDKAVVRWFNSDVDGISGLIIDQWQDQFIITCQSAGIELHFELIKTIVVNLYNPSSIIKNDADKIRNFDRLEVSSSELTNQQFHPFELNLFNTKLSIRGIHDYSPERYWVQKIISEISTQKIVWDLFSGKGTLGKVALSNGAKSVLFVDNNTQHTAEIAALSLKHTTVLEQNVFDFLKQIHKQQLPELIILDCPIFNLPKGDEALSPYLNITLNSFRILRKKGGFLLILNNSSKIGYFPFEQMFLQAGQSTKTQFSLLQTVTLPPDYGVNLLYQHTDYLKAFLLYVHPSE